MKYQPDRPLIYGETLESLQLRLTADGHPAFRAKQILDWIYNKRVDSWDAMLNLPKNLRQWLNDSFILVPNSEVLVRQADDVTDKLLLKQGDGSLIETVLIRAPQVGVGLDQSRKTICLSTQVGCAFGCKFCASGLAGWKRDLLAGEIVGQIMRICWKESHAQTRDNPERVPFDNIVIMGMGEPLANYDNLMRALTILNADWGFQFGARRITVSTSGLVPRIYDLAKESLQFRLAISLHGATNDVRSQIMPVNKAYPLEQLIPAAKAFTETHKRMLTLEYILIDGINDTFEQAEALVDIARELHAHVNLIPYNKVDGLPWKRPSLMRQQKFLDVLEDARISVTIRREKGHDIAAACGQLRLKTEAALSS
jgi:23S rRNA (adenine2503-C2)-methyltransferase